jgi:hypothetical protein|nr:MAG TPA: hypothetical protein [Herelleviridae sp.]
MNTLKKLDRIIETTKNEKFINLRNYYNECGKLSFKQKIWIQKFYYSLFERVEENIEYDHTLYGYDI